MRETINTISQYNSLAKHSFQLRILTRKHLTSDVVQCTMNVLLILFCNTWSKTDVIILIVFFPILLRHCLEIAQNLPLEGALGTHFDLTF